MPSTELRQPPKKLERNDLNPDFYRAIINYFLDSYKENKNNFSMENVIKGLKIRGIKKQGEFFVFSDDVIKMFEGYFKGAQSNIPNFLRTLIELTPYSRDIQLQEQEMAKKYRTQPVSPLLEKEQQKAKKIDEVANKITEKKKELEEISNKVKKHEKEPEKYKREIYELNKKTVSLTSEISKLEDEKFKYEQGPDTRKFPEAPLLQQDTHNRSKRLMELEDELENTDEKLLKKPTGEELAVLKKRITELINQINFLKHEPGTKKLDPR